MKPKNWFVYTSCLLSTGCPDVQQYSRNISGSFSLVFCALSLFPWSFSCFSCYLVVLVLLLVSLVFRVLVLFLRLVLVRVFSCFMCFLPCCFSCSFSCFSRCPFWGHLVTGFCQELQLFHSFCAFTSVFAASDMQSYIFPTHFWPQKMKEHVVYILGCRSPLGPLRGWDNEPTGPLGEWSGYLWLSTMVEGVGWDANARPNGDQSAKTSSLDAMASRTLGKGSE